MAGSTLASTSPLATFPNAKDIFVFSQAYFSTSLLRPVGFDNAGPSADGSIFSSWLSDSLSTDGPTLLNTFDEW